MMIKSCRVVNTNGAVSVFDMEGSISPLYQQALDFTGDTDQALRIWAVTQTDGWSEMFGDDMIPSVEEVLRYIDNFDNTQTLSESELQQSRMMMNDLGMDSLFTLTTRMNSLFQPNGYFEIDEKRLLKSGIYSQEEIEALNPNKMRDLLARMNVYNLDFDVFSDNTRIFTSTTKFKDTEAEKTIFGTFPFVNEQDIIKTISDTANGDFSKPSLVKAIADSAFSALLDSSSFINRITNYLQDKTNVPVLFFDGNTFTSRNLSTFTTTRNTILANVDTVELEETLDFLESIEEEVWDDKKSAIKKLLKETTSELLQYNVDVVGIEQNFSNRQGVIDLVRSTVGMLNNPVDENINSFSLIKDSLIVPPMNSVLETLPEKYKPLNIVRVDTNFSEDALFENSGLIRIDNSGLYQRVQRTSLENLYDAVYRAYLENTINIDPKYFDTENLKLAENEIFTREGIRRFIQSREIGFDSSFGEEISLYQVIFDHSPLGTNQASFAENPEYLKTEFVSDFYAYQLEQKSNNTPVYNKILKYFSITDADITLSNPNVDVTGIRFEKELRDYAKLKKEGIIKTLTETDDYINEDLEALNNPDSVKELQMGNFISDEEFIITAPNTDLYLRTGENIYRKLLDSVDGSIYGQIRVEENNVYFDTNTNFSFNRNRAEQKLNSAVRSIEPILPQEVNMETLEVTTKQSVNDTNLEMTNLYPQSELENIQKEFNECAL